jgi:hypothetical protein
MATRLPQGALALIEIGKLEDYFAVEPTSRRSRGD